VDRRLRAALEGGAVLTLTIIVAVIVAHRESGPTVPAKVSIIGSTNPGTEHVQFLVRGGGCGKHIREHIHGPAVQYRTQSIDVGFRIDRDGVPGCPGADPGQRYTLNLVTPLSDRTLRDDTATPPTPFPTEPPAGPGETTGSK
jgi:hypothetical protein